MGRMLWGQAGISGTGMVWAALGTALLGGSNKIPPTSLQGPVMVGKVHVPGWPFSDRVGAGRVMDMAFSFSASKESFPF